MTLKCLVRITVMLNINKKKSYFVFLNCVLPKSVENTIIVVIDDLVFKA